MENKFIKVFEKIKKLRGNKTIVEKVKLSEEITEPLLELEEEIFEELGPSVGAVKIKFRTFAPSIKKDILNDINHEIITDSLSRGELIERFKILVEQAQKMISLDPKNNDIHYKQKLSREQLKEKKETNKVDILAEKDAASRLKKISDMEKEELEKKLRETIKKEYKN